MKHLPNKKRPHTLLNSEGRYDARRTGAEPTNMNQDAHAFQITSERHGEGRFVKVGGSVTIDSSAELRRVLLRILKGPNGPRLTLDFSEVIYIDTFGLAVLIELLRCARQFGKSLQLSGLRERPRYLLESTGLLSFFKEAPTKQ
jgi:anti-sigma B factor antagonist